MMTLKKLVKQALGYLPSRLPVGMTEFDSWAQDFMATYDLATEDETSIKWVLASLIVALKPGTAYLSKRYFYLHIQAAAAKQIASAVFQDIKNKQLEANKAKEVNASNDSAVY